MSIRDIIEAARRISTTAEEAIDVGVPGWQDVLDDADTILAHGPELALMEAVCEADDPEPGPIHCQLCGGAGVMSLRDCERCGGSGLEQSWQRWRARQDLRDALTALPKGAWTVSKLSDLEAALEAKREAEAALRVAVPTYKDLVLARSWANRRDDLYDLLTDDTIAALVAVACRAREHMEAWDSMEEAVNERHKVLYEEQHGQFVSDQWKAELSAAIREANVVEHRTAEALAAALATLVKEADHDRA